MNPPGAAAQPVAVVGIGCRFPGGAHGPQSFWRLLCEGRDAVTQVPADRWRLEDVAGLDAARGQSVSRWGGFLSGVDAFDPQFFGISPHEAARMDPQQRVLTEVAWEALEDAGLVAQRLSGSMTGVFVGIANSDYAHQQVQDLGRIDAYTGTGNAFSIAANRLSYLFDLRGPSMAIDTACSSSLVAVHQACASLAQGECSLALAAGVNLILSPALAVNFTRAGAMAADGRCKAFDARADGYVRSEGVGVVVLKPLSQALEDRDRIYGLILGSAVNQDGRSNGLMAPNPHAQQAVLRAAYSRAGVRPDQVQYVEAHGTGTLLGDPIEAKALAAVVSAGKDESDPCLIGSVKTNLGHMEAAAGIGGLIKTLLMVRHRQVPPSLHYEQPNPHIPFDSLGLRVVESLRPWPGGASGALAGVSSFGFGGTNAHVVVGEAPLPAVAGQPAGAAAHVFALSARSGEALRELAAKYLEHFAEPDESAAHAVSFATTVRRTHHEHRLACVGSSTRQFAEALRAFEQGEQHPGLSWGERQVGRRPKAAFLFSGQGPRWWPLGADLFDREPVFREVIDHCDAVLRRYDDWSLIDGLRAEPGACALADPGVGQPALCAVQMALAALWRSWGVEPETVAGHSVGEVAAAQVAGALSLESALRVALHRGRVIRAADGTGRMAVVALSFEEARGLLERGNGAPVWVAAENGPNTSVLTGEAAAIEALARDLTAEGVFCRVLESVRFASHSPLMEAPADRLGALLADLRPDPARLPMHSTVTGAPIADTPLDGNYWAANLRRPVLFDRVVAGLVESGHDVFVEISPHPMLADAVAERMSLLSPQQAQGAVVASLHRDQPGRASVLAQLGRLYSAGYPVDWGAVRGRTGPMVQLPSYPWQRRRYWRDDEFPGRRRAAHSGHPILETFMQSATQPSAYHWCAQVDLEQFPYLRDHAVGGTAVLPASLLLDTALAGARQILGDKQASVHDVCFTGLTVVPENASQATIQLVLLPDGTDGASFRFYNRPAGQGGPGGGWSEVAHGVIRTLNQPAAQDQDLGGLLAKARERCARPADSAEHYAALSRAGLEYGPAFQGVRALWRGAHEAVGQLHDLPDLTADTDAYLVHPVLLDSCLQVLAATIDPAQHEAAGYLPVDVGRFTLWQERAVPRWAHAVIGGPSADGRQLTGGRIILFDEAGRPVGEIDGITVRRLDNAGTRGAAEDSLLTLRWRELPQSAPAAAQQPAVGGEAGWWLLLADRRGMCSDLKGLIEARGQGCVTVGAGAGYRRLGEDRYEVDPARPEDFKALIDQLVRERPSRCAGVVHAWSVDASVDEDDATGSLQESQDLGPVSALHLVQALAHDAREGLPRLFLVTRGAQSLADEAPAPAQCALWGLARVIGLEHAELRPRAVDLDPRSADPARDLLDELLAADEGDQVALRGGGRFAPRLEPWSTGDGGAESDSAWRERPYDPRRDANHRVLATRPGILESLAPTPWHRLAPGPGQVEIEVAAAGLNFNDVLKALGNCPGVPPGSVPLGGECAGRVIAVGDGVTRLRPGDAVMAVAPSSMAAYTTTSADLVAPRPAGLTDEQAAAVPVAFLTAVYGLEYLARLRRGETLLVHSAAGGVGLAALQVARRNGARVFATAGSEQKRELLREMGAEHVMDSRSLGFAAEVTRITGGRGVDVVLNSLAGEALTRSLALLAPNGRFVEIGKQDVYAGNPVGLGLLKHNRSLFAVDLERSFAEQPELIAELFEQVLRGFAGGDFTPPVVTAFDYGDAEAAFTHMAQARHIGKIVLRPHPPRALHVRPDSAPVRSDATYLITGGLGALGLRTARYLVDQGARHLVLTGRHAPSPDAAEAVESLQTEARVVVECADVSLPDAVEALLAKIEDSMPPLAGVVHAAGVLDDGLLTQLDRERFRTVAAPKAEGAWNLHRGTVHLDLDFFVLYSSAAALLGSPGQGNYAAANAFLDGLAMYRRARGLPALSIAWGPWAQAGLAARPDRGGALSARGILSLDPRDGIAALDRLLRSCVAHACVLPLDRAKLREAADHALAPELLAGLLEQPGNPAATPAQSSQIHRSLLAVEPGRRRRDILTRHCREQAGRVLKLDPSALDPAVPLTELGFDSLMSLELRKRLESTLETTLPATVTWRFPTIDALVPFLAERMQIALEAEAETAPRRPQPLPEPDPRPGDALDALPDGDIEALPEGDIEALLLEKITQIDEGRWT
ncbi:type I polyketide synthase [Actinocrinis puniceicyclus]|uniref:Type I polyketide synthase n=1 Tax=Actinocrinis puniceicyclus TaxID=977794 RepID=A0A8J7WIK0_9ACTN|nr:type I polyketide synthase [Actinocrinis puniceicyclus]MBS2962971.1 type I polyketide synthase [Actinocrinis puniceicyclus]